LSANPAQRAALNPLLSCWFSISVRSLLQMSPDLNRRIWFVVDELPTLQKLKELESLITEGRKYGGCGLLALQSPSQLEEIYGRASAQTIIGNCATRIIFAEHDPEIAERISRSLGECEIKEYQEGISYGAHEVRDGVTLSLQSKKMPIVSATEIQSLESNCAYIKMPGNLPISKIRLKLNKTKKISQKFELQENKNA
jgi:type IV secretory pathway TraG/TraD family ATPase VirD4